MFFSGRMYTTDVLAQLEAAGSLVGMRPFLTVSGDYGWIVEGVREGFFIPHGPGFSILLIPAALVTEVLGPLAGKITVAFSNYLLGLVLVGFWFAAASLRYSRVGVYRFLLVAVGSMAPVYCKMTFDVTAAAAALMAAYYFHLDGKPALAGACFGMALLVRLDSLLFIPLFLGDRREMAVFAAAVLPFLAAILGANGYRFGNPLEDGHSQDPAMAVEPFGGGLYGLIASPGKGLLFYAPLSVVALFIRGEWKLKVPFVLSLFLHGSLHDWTGGTGWGPRFLFTSLPFLLMPLCRRGAGGKIFPLAATAGVIAVLPALWTNASAVEQAAGPDLFDLPGRQAVVWSFGASPMVLSMDRLFREVPDVLGAHVAASAGLSPWIGVFLQFAAGAVLVVMGVRRAAMERLKEASPG